MMLKSTTDFCVLMRICGVLQLQSACMQRAAQTVLSTGRLATVISLKTSFYNFYQFKPSANRLDGLILNNGMLSQPWLHPFDREQVQPGCYIKQPELAHPS
eukprot:scaffold28215_cov13-Tisochrysis_lutea.AAC.1